MSETPHEDPVNPEGSAPEEVEGDPAGASNVETTPPSEEKEFQTPGPTDETVSAAPGAEVTAGEGQETAINNPNDLGQAQVQEAMDEATNKGVVGSKVDPTPDENYSLQTPVDAPTPETDPDLAAKAREASFGNRLTNIETASHLTPATPASEEGGA